MMILKTMQEYAGLLQDIYDISIAVLLICSIFTIRLFRKIKRQRKLSAFESMMFFILKMAIFLWLASFLLMEYGEYLFDFFP